MKQSDFSKVQEKVCLVVDCKQQYHRTEGNRVGLRGGGHSSQRTITCYVLDQYGAAKLLKEINRVVGSGPFSSLVIFSRIFLFLASLQFLE